MTTTIRLTLVLLLLAITRIVNAQLSTNEKPYSFYNKQFALRSTTEEQKQSAIPSLATLTKEDAQDSMRGIPPRFGYAIPVSYTPDNAGSWQNLPDGGRLWQLTISSPGALSINLLYDKFWLPDGGKLFLYNTSQTYSIGAFTSKNNKGTRQDLKAFATGLVYSDKITLEYYQPAHVKEKPVISIAQIVHGYRYITLPATANGTETPNNLGTSKPCNINVNCPEGLYFQNEKRAVALILVNGNRYCTGSLVNTTAGNQVPYFLTANHCLGGWANTNPLDAASNPNASLWSFYWNYESPNCTTPAAEPTFFTTVGATVVANNAATDFALLRLTEDPKSLACYRPYSLGWTRSNANSGPGLVGIHHPDGDIKKISLASSASNYGNTINWTDGVVSPANTHWAASFTQGGMQGGSSGSPLLNSTHQLIGQLHGGNGECSPMNKYYGRFDISWDNVPIPQRRLRDWLDPSNSNITSLTGTGDKYDISGPAAICNSATFSITPTLATGSTVSWFISNTYPYGATLAQINSPAATQTTVSQVGNTGGTISLNATITDPCGNSTTLTKTNISIGGGISTITGYYRNQNNQYFNLKTNYQGTNYIQPNFIFNTTVSNTELATATWSLIHGTTSFWSQFQLGSNNGNILQMQIPPNNDVVVVRLSNSGSCGSQYFDFIFSTNPPGGIFRLSPNPATSMVNIQPNTSTQLTGKQVAPPPAILEVNIYDQTGILKRRQRPNGNTTNLQINVSGLTAGIYHAEIITKTGKERHSLVITQ